MKKLKFHKQFNKPILEGRKTQTARTALNNLLVGDQVAAVNGEKQTPFAVLQITSIENRMLGTFGPADAKREGLDSFGEFVSVWKKLHPRKGFIVAQPVYVIQFRLIEPVGLPFPRGVEFENIFRNDGTAVSVPITRDLRR